MTGFIPPSPYSVVLTMVMWESSQWLGKNIVIRIPGKHLVFLSVSQYVFPYKSKYMTVHTSYNFYLYFSAGVSLIGAAAAAGVTVGVNFNDASKCENEARSCRDSAYEKRRTANSLKDDVTRMDSDIDRLEREIVRLKERIGKK